MSSSQKSFGAGAIVSGVVYMVMLGVFGWVGNQTFENSVDKERFITLMEMQVKETKSLNESMTELRDTIVGMSKQLAVHDVEIDILKETVEDIRDGRQ